MYKTSINNIPCVMHDCPDCHVLFAITAEHDDRLMDCGNDFYCPNGHRMSYKTSVQARLNAALEECQHLHLMTQNQQREIELVTNKLATAQRKIKRLKAK